MTKRKIFVADVRSHNSNGKRTGHFVYLAEMYKKIFNDSCDVLIAGGPVYLNHFTNKELCLLPYDVSGTSIIDKWHTMLNAIVLFKRAKGEIIVMQQASVITYFVAIALFYRKTSKLFMIQYSNEGVRTFFRRCLYGLIKKKIDGTICPNNIVGKIYGIPYLAIPDYIYIESNVESKKSICKDKIFDFCVLGRISPEKEVVEVVNHLKNKGFKIIIAGLPQTKLLEEELKLACRGDNNILLKLDYLDDETYQHYISISKFSILNYHAEYSLRSSGVVFDMIFNNTPVVGRKCTALQLIKEYELGYLYEDLSDFCPNEFLKESKYDKYIQNIYKYKEKHKLYVQQLKSFIKP